MERLTPTSPAAPAVAADGDWPARAADTIEAVVTTVRDRSVTPLTLVAKAMVYGLMAGIVGIAVLVLLAVGTVRVLVVYAVPVWAAEMIVGGIFALAGLFVLSRAWKARRSATEG